MTAPDPPAVASVEELLAKRLRPIVDEQLDMYEPVIRAHERAQVLAEVDAALRDNGRWNAWLKTQVDRNLGRTWAWIAADYLRDTLAGDDGEA